jgi:hypothetical protein
MLGLISYLQRECPRVGFFKPVGTDYHPLGDNLFPRNVVLMHTAFKMKGDPASMSAMPEDAAFKVLRSIWTVSGQLVGADVAAQFSADDR